LVVARGKTGIGTEGLEQAGPVGRQVQQVNLNRLAIQFGNEFHPTGGIVVRGSADVCLHRTDGDEDALENARRWRATRRVTNAHVDCGHPVVKLAGDRCLAARHQGQDHCNKGENAQRHVRSRYLAFGRTAESHPHTSRVSVARGGNPEGGDFFGLPRQYEKREPDSQGDVPCLQPNAPKLESYQ
jgi:hypothetical protein